MFAYAPGRSLKNGGRNWICTRGNVVYEIECKRCLNDANRKVAYIVKTERPLPTPWTKHQAELHRDGKVEIITQVRFVAHQWVMKQGIYAEMHRTALVCSSSPEQKQLAVEKVNKLFADNGYTANEIKRFQRRCNRRTKGWRRDGKRSLERAGVNPPILNIQYISEKFTSDVRKLLPQSKMDARVVHRSAPTLRRIFDKDWPP
ncbi:hypothetical protein ACOME3_008753 [Neoechinorhynchus agilis]